jgi:hypothetical protein
MSRGRIAGAGIEGQNRCAEAAENGLGAVASPEAERVMEGLIVLRRAEAEASLKTSQPGRNSQIDAAMRLLWVERV